MGIRDSVEEIDVSNPCRFVLVVLLQVRSMGRMNTFFVIPSSSEPFMKLTVVITDLSMPEMLLPGPRLRRLSHDAVQQKAVRM